MNTLQNYIEAIIKKRAKLLKTCVIIVGTSLVLSWILRFCIELDLLADLFMGLANCGTGLGIGVYFINQDLRRAIEVNQQVKELYDNTKKLENELNEFEHNLNSDTWNMKKG